MNGLYYKELFSKKEGGNLPQLVIAENENMQSRFVVEKILALREEGIPLRRNGSALSLIVPFVRPGN